MHYQEADAQTEAHDQQAFDQAVDRKGKVVLEVIAGLGIFAAVMMSMVALVQSGQRSESVVSQAASAKPATSAAVAVAPAVPNAISLSVIPTYKLGPDGKKHDAFTKTEFAVKVGQSVKLTINNGDDVAHSITSPVIGVNIVAQPGKHTYTLVVKQAGRFQWFCMIPCDSDANGWAMKNPGFMSGYITAT